MIIRMEGAPLHHDNEPVVFMTFWYAFLLYMLFGHTVLHRLNRFELDLVARSLLTSSGFLFPFGDEPLFT